MSIRLGLALFALAGCVSQPPRPAASSEAPLARVAALDRFARGHSICLGVEHLPPQSPTLTPEALPLRGDQQEPRFGGQPARAPFAIETEARGARTIAPYRQPEAKDNPLAATAFQFLEDLQGQDRRRLARDFGIRTTWMQRMDTQSPAIKMRSDELEAEDQESQLGERGQNALRRPLQRLLRRTPLVSGMEVGIAQLAATTPEPRADREAADRLDLGRLTMVLRPSRGSDALELGYRRAGFRISSSRQQLKCSYTMPIIDRLFLDLIAGQDYATASWRLRGILRWEHSATTSVHLSVGDDVGVGQRMSNTADGAALQGPVPGVLLHAVHSF